MHRKFLLRVALGLHDNAVFARRQSPERKLEAVVSAVAVLVEAVLAVPETVTVALTLVGRTVYAELRDLRKIALKLIRRESLEAKKPIAAEQALFLLKRCACRRCLGLDCRRLRRGSAALCRNRDRQFRIALCRNFNLLFAGRCRRAAECQGIVSAVSIFFQHIRGGTEAVAKVALFKNRSVHTERRNLREVVAEFLPGKSLEVKDGLAAKDTAIRAEGRAARRCLLLCRGLLGRCLCRRDRKV